MWNDANMITSFPNFYCAIHADAHKHHIKQIVHLTYARPMCCVYSTRFTLPRSLPFLPKLTQIERKLILEGPMATTPMVVSMKEVIGFIGINVWWVDFILWNTVKHLAPKLQKRSRYHLHPCPVWGIIRHLLDGLIPNDSHFPTFCGQVSWQILAKFSMVRLRSMSFFFNFPLAVGCGDRSSWNSSQNISNAWRLQEDKGS